MQMPSHSFSLYITGQTGVSIIAVRNAKRLCKGLIDCELTIIDILAEPDRAERHRVIATPLLVKESSPVIFLVGDLSDTRKVAAEFGVSPDYNARSSDSPAFPPNVFTTEPETDNR